MKTFSKEFYSMRLIYLLFSVLIVMGQPAFSYAQDTSRNLVKIRVLPEKAMVEGGEKIWIATEQSITPEWHTYWKNPGDSGTPPLITWSLPDGFEISDIHWPTPHKMPYGPLLNYGYEDKVILLQELKTPETLPEGPITLSADIEILVCKEECIPEYGTYTLTLNGSNAETEDNSAYIMSAREKLPGYDDWPVFFDEEDGKFIFEATIPATIRGDINLTSAEFFPEEWGLIDNAAAPEAFIRDEQLVIRQKRGDRDLDAIEILNGVLVFETNEGRQYAMNTRSTPLSAEKTAADGRRHREE